MTPYELKAAVEASGNERHYFTRDTMKCFGDTMRNYGVRRVSVIASFDAAGTYHDSGVTRDAWELYRKRPVKHGNQSSAYFDPVTFARIFAKR
jgi:hypothetical protein